MNREQTNQINIKIVALEKDDITQLESIFIEHVKDRKTGEVLWKEIDEIKECMLGGKDKYGRRMRYLVAKDTTGKVLGCMAYSVPDPDMIKHFKTTPRESTELLNAFVSLVFIGKGVGSKLFLAICDTVRGEGKKQLLVNSGLRYKLSWGFYDKMCDESCGFIIGKYGKGGDAKTWKKTL